MKNGEGVKETSGEFKSHGIWPNVISSQLMLLEKG